MRLEVLSSFFSSRDRLLAGDTAHDRLGLEGLQIKASAENIRQSYGPLVSPPNPGLPT
jgi:hypothetical protein